MTVNVTIRYKFISKPVLIDLVHNVVMNAIARLGISITLVLVLLFSSVAVAQFSTNVQVATIQFTGAFNQLSVNVTPELQSIGIVSSGDVITYDIVIENLNMQDLSLSWQLDNANPSNPLPASAILRINDVDWLETETRILLANTDVTAQVIVFIVDLVDPALVFFDFTGEITFNAVIISP